LTSLGSIKKTFLVPNKNPFITEINASVAVTQHIYSMPPRNGASNAVTNSFTLLKLINVFYSKKETKRPMSDSSAHQMKG
jgi:hypothetical protein